MPTDAGTRDRACRRDDAMRCDFPTIAIPHVHLPMHSLSAIPTAPMVRPKNASRAESSFVSRKGVPHTNKTSQ